MRRIMTAIWFSSFKHSVMAQTRLEWFWKFIVYMLIVSNVKITFGWVQFVSHKSCIFTCIYIFGRIRYIKVHLHQPSIVCEHSKMFANVFKRSRTFANMHEGLLFTPPEPHIRAVVLNHLTVIPTWHPGYQNFPFVQRR